MRRVEKVKAQPISIGFGSEILDLGHVPRFVQPGLAERLESSALDALGDAAQVQDL